MKLYTQIVLSTYIFLPAICIFLSPTLIMGLAKAQHQKAKLMADALTARARAATALARNNARYAHKRLVPNARHSPDLNIANNPFNLRRAKRQAMQMPMESQRQRSHLNQEADSLTTLQNLWNMNNFGIPPNFGDSMRHARREEPHNENIPPNGDHEKRSGAFFTGRNVYDTIVNQANVFSNNEGDYIETNETVDENPNDFVDPSSSEELSERTSKKLKKKKNHYSKTYSQEHYPSNGYYGRSSGDPVIIMENPEDNLNSQLIQSGEARNSKKGHSRGHESSNSYYGRESDLPEKIASVEPTLTNELNTPTEERSPSKKSKKNKGHSGNYYYFRRSEEGLPNNLEQTPLNPELMTTMESRKSKKGYSHSHGNSNSYYGRESDLLEMIPSDPTLMAPLWVEFEDMEARTHGKKSKKKHGSSGHYAINGESVVELETPTDPQLMATNERKSKKGHSRGYGNSNYYYSRQADLPEEIIPNQPHLIVHLGNEEDLKSALRSQHPPSEYNAQNNDEVVVGVPPQAPIMQGPLVVVPENQAQIGSIPPPPQNSNMAMVGTEPQTQMRVPQDPVLARQADPRCKDDDNNEKHHGYYTPPLVPQIMDPNEYYQHTMEQVEELNKKMAEATKSLLYHPQEDIFHVPGVVPPFVGPAIPQYPDEIPQITPYDEKSANPHHLNHGFSHTHSHTFTHSHGHIPSENIGNGYAHEAAYTNPFSHSKHKGFGSTKGFAEAHASAGNGFHGYGGGFGQAESDAKALTNQGSGYNEFGSGGGFGQAEAQAKALAHHGSGFDGFGGGFSHAQAQAKALANHGSGFNSYGGGFSHANAQAKALSGEGLSPVGPIGGGFGQAEAQSNTQSGNGFGQYSDGFAQAGASSQGLGFGKSQANAQAISQSVNDGFGQAASQALAQASTGTQAAPQFFQVLGPSSFVNAHARDAIPLQALPRSDMTHEMEGGKGRFSRAHGSGNDVFDGLNIASGIVNSALGLGSKLQPNQGDLSEGEMARNEKETIDFVKNIVDSNTKDKGSVDENAENVSENEGKFDALERSELRMKRETGSKREGIDQTQPEGIVEGLNLASDIVHSALDLSSKMQSNMEEARNKNHENSLSENIYFPSENLATSLVQSVINPTMSRLGDNTEKLGIPEALERTMNLDLPATNPEKQGILNIASDVVHSALYPNSMPELKEPLTGAHKLRSPDNNSQLLSNTYNSHTEPQLSDSQHISTTVKPEDSILRSNTGNGMVESNTNLESLKERSEDAQFRKRNIGSKDHDNLTLMINPDDISVEEEVRTETSLTDSSQGEKLENNADKSMPETNNSSLMQHTDNTQLLSNANQEIHKTQLADRAPGIEHNDDHIGGIVGYPHIVVNTVDHFEETANQDHKGEIVGMPLPRFHETVTDITSILGKKSLAKPDSSEESSEEKTKVDQQNTFSKPSTVITSDNTTESEPTPTMTPAQIENIQFTIPDEEEQFDKAEDIAEAAVMNATNAEPIIKKNTTEVITANEGQSSDKDNSTNLLSNLEDVMKLLNEDEKNAFIKQEKDLIADILGNNLNHEATLKPEQVPNATESQSRDAVASPHLFQAKSNNFHEEWERVHHEYARRSRSPTKETLDTILGAQRETVGQIQQDATGDDDLLMISFIGDGIIKDLQNRKEQVFGEEKIENRLKSVAPNMTPITKLLIDPNTKIDVPKTFDNVGAVLRHTFESPKAPMYHVRNMLGNTKNTVMSAVKIPPSNVVVPSIYDITKVFDQNPQLGAINEEMLRIRGKEASPIKSPSADSIGVMDTFQKLGGIVKESVNSGKNVVVHATDVVNDAKQAFHAKPPRLLGQKQILATKTSFPPFPMETKSVILAPKLLDFQGGAVAAAQEQPEQFVGVGHILDAIGVSKPESSDLKFNKIVLEPTPSGLFRLMAVRPNQRTDVREVEETLESLNEAEQSVGAKNLKDFFSKMHQEMKEILTSQQEERKRKRDEKLRSSKAKLSASNKDYVLGKTKSSAKSAEASPSKSTIQKIFEENEKIKLPIEVLKVFTDDVPKGVDDINFEQNSMPQLNSRMNSQDETVGLYLLPALMTPFMGEPPQELYDGFLRENGDTELLQRNSIDESKRGHVHPIIPLNLNITIPQSQDRKNFNLSDYLPKVPVVNSIVEDVKMKENFKDVDGINRQFLRQKHPLSSTREGSEGHLLGAINPLLLEKHLTESLELNSASKTGKKIDELEKLLPANKSVQTNQPSAHSNLAPITARPAKTLQINKEQTGSSTIEISDIKSTKSSTEHLSSIDRTTKPAENEAEPTERTSMDVAERYKKPFMGLSSRDKIKEFLDQYNKPYIEENFQISDPVKDTVYGGEDYNYI